MSGVIRYGLVIILSLAFVVLPSPHQPTAQIAEEFEGVHIEIDIATNRLTVFLNSIKMYSFRVATGKDKQYTPLGHFYIMTKVKEPWYLPKNIAGGHPRNPLGSRWLGLSVPNTSGYKYGIHGTNNPYSIGFHVTQGCIRLRNTDVEWLFRHIEIGTPVIIIDSSKREKPEHDSEPSFRFNKDAIELEQLQ